MAAVEPPQEHLVSLYTDHHGWLKGWFRNKLAGSPDAADLAQDTFLRLLNRASNGNAVSDLRQPRAYLTRIAQGLLVDHWRRRDVEQAYLEALALLPTPEVPSPESRLLIIETLVRIQTALDALKPRARQAFLLAQLEGWSGPAIAEKLGVSLATVERDLNTAWQRCYRVYFL